MRRTINFILIFFCAATLSALPREEQRRDFQKTVALAAGKSLRLDNSLGSVRISTQSKGEADIRATIKCSADTAAEAKSVCDEIQISVQESGTGVSVRTDYPQNQGRRRRNVGFGVYYEIVIPENSPFDVRNRFGNVTITDSYAPGVINNSNGGVSLSGGRGRQQIENSFGNVDVRTNTGDVIVRNGNGNVVANDIAGNVDISNRFGRVTVDKASGTVTINSNNGIIEATAVGGTASVVNTFGGVTLTGVKGDAIVNNQNGAVKATDVGGSAELHTTFDRVTFSHIGRKVDVRASNASVTGDTVGESAMVETTFGSVDLRGIKGSTRVTASNTSIVLNDVAGSAYARTTFNGVTVNGGAGAITVENQNGSVSVDARTNRCQPILLSTTFGPIRVRIPSGIGYDVTARTSFGRISSEAELTVMGSLSPESLSGKIAGGGCEMRLIGQNGNIEIQKGTK